MEWLDEWPFADERAFWSWAYDPDAELDDIDEDLLLHHPDGLQLLVAAAADGGCAKQDYCANVLGAYTCEIVRWERTEIYPALRVAADLAATITDGRIRAWAAHVDCLFAYQQPCGPVNRATAEKMAGDLLGGPIVRARIMAAGVREWPAICVTPDGKEWECRDSWTSTVVRINRHTGKYRFARRGTLA